MAIPHLQEASRLPADLTAEQEAWAKKLVALYQEQMVAASDIVPLSEMFFRTEVTIDDEEAAAVMTESQVPTVLSAFLAKIEAMDEFTVENIGASIKAVQKETGVKGKGLFMPIRVALTGQMHGRDLNQTIYLLGQERVKELLQSRI